MLSQFHCYATLPGVAFLLGGASMKPDQIKTILNDYRHAMRIVNAGNALMANGRTPNRLYSSAKHVVLVVSAGIALLNKRERTIINGCLSGCSSQQLMNELHCHKTTYYRIKKQALAKLGGHFATDNKLCNWYINDTQP